MYQFIVFSNYWEIRLSHFLNEAYFDILHRINLLWNVFSTCMQILRPIEGKLHDLWPFILANTWLSVIFSNILMTLKRIDIFFLLTIQIHKLKQKATLNSKNNFKISKKELKPKWLPKILDGRQRFWQRNNRKKVCEHKISCDLIEK